MATPGHRLLLRLSILLGLLAIAADARPGRHFHPCKTLIFFSTSSFPVDQKPNFSPQNPSSTLSGRRSVTFFLTEGRELDPKPNFLPSYPTIFVDRPTINEEKRPSPLGFHSSFDDSFRDLTKDILSIVGSLLFGVGCGALTAATLYLMWSLFSPNRFEFRDSDDDEEDDDVSLKKMGYVGIPAADTPVTAASAKAVV